RFSRDWSSDVCSSDLPRRIGIRAQKALDLRGIEHVDGRAARAPLLAARGQHVSAALVMRGLYPAGRRLTSDVETAHQIENGIRQIGRASCRERVSLAV